MRNRVPYGVKFISRFFLEIVPPVLAAVIGGVLFAHYYTGSNGSDRNAAGTASAIPADGRAALVDEEHAQLVEFLKRGREAAKPTDAAAGSAGPAKPRVAVTRDASPAKDSVVKLRRAPLSIVAEGPPKPQPVAVATSGPLTSAQPGRTASNPVPPADIPNVSPPAIVAPTVPPDTAASERAGEDKGVFGSMLSKASEFKDKAIEISRVREAIDFVRDMPGRVLPSPDKSSDAGAPGAPPQRFSQTSPE
jgi:hypothetical protein